jgi:hypothetical protein
MIKSRYTAMIVPAALVTTVLAFAQPASAMIITNHENHDVTLKVAGMDGQPVRKLTLKPNEKVHSVCERGCVISMAKSGTGSTVFEGDENVTIQNGDFAIAE